MKTGGVAHVEEIKGGIELAVKLLNFIGAGTVTGMIFTAFKLLGFKNKPVKILFNTAGLVVGVTVGDSVYDWLNGKNLPEVKKILDILL